MTLSTTSLVRPHRRLKPTTRCCVIMLMICAIIFILCPRVGALTTSRLHHSSTIAALQPSNSINWSKRHSRRRGYNCRHDGRLCLFHPVSDLTGGEVLADFSPAAASLFNNMKLPAAVVTAGMISLGFATTFPELPATLDENGNPKYSQELRQRCEMLRRLHIVVALISITSELIVVMWAAVEVNQLTERVYSPAASVWYLIQTECDLAWSAVNSHFVLGIIGFVSMLSLRAYVMLIAFEASNALMSAAMAGTAAALCLMISIVNRGVEAGGGNGVGYGSTILDLLVHYVYLLSQTAIDIKSPGPLEFSAIIFEITSIGFILKVALTGDDKKSEAEKELEVNVDTTAETLKRQPMLFQGTLSTTENESAATYKKERTKFKPSDSSEATTKHQLIDQRTTDGLTGTDLQPKHLMEDEIQSNGLTEYDSSLESGLLPLSHVAIMNEIVSSVGRRGGSKRSSDNNNHNNNDSNS